MAWCPFAIRKPIAKARSAITPRAIIMHTAVSGAASLFGYFSGVGDDSHFYVDNTGRIEQYVDTSQAAYANRNANSFAISIETWDNRDPAKTPWNPAQVAAITRLNNWIADTHHTIPRRQIASVAGSGIGWHAMFGAPSAWTSAVGKTCPGAPRIGQMHSTIIPAFISGTTTSTDWLDMATRDDVKAAVGEVLPDGVAAGIRQAEADRHPYPGDPGDGRNAVDNRLENTQRLIKLTEQNDRVIDLLQQIANRLPA